MSNPYPSPNPLENYSATLYSEPIARTIIGRTNGANSSEHALSVSAVRLVMAIGAVAVGLGLLAPEQYQALEPLLSLIVAAVVANNAAYTAGRSWIKASLAKEPPADIIIPGEITDEKK